MSAAASFVQGDRRRREGGILAGALLAALLLGLLAGNLAAANRLILLGGLGLVVVPIVIWRHLEAGVLGLTSAALLVEQQRIGASVGDWTDRTPLFVSLNDGFHLSGIYFNPAEILIALVLLVTLFRAAAERRLRAPSPPMAVAITAMAACLAIGEVRGLGGGGDWKMTLWELRPFVYVIVLFLLTVQLAERRAILDSFLWAFVAMVGLKSLQGLVVLISTRLVGERPDFLLTHEEAFFLGMFIVLNASLWLFKVHGRLRTVTTALLPIVTVVNLANSRRTAWLILAAALLALLVLTWARMPQRRRMLVTVVAVMMAVGTIYLSAFWSSTGTLGQPARAIRSTVAPSQRDRLSDLYRVLENANLELAIKRSFPLGVGFGVPIDYAIPIVDLSSSDPFIKFITHDGVLYVWMRMGIAGIAAFWFLIGTAIIAAIRLLRAPDPKLAVVGAFAVCALIGYVIEGYYDLGLFWFRMAIFMGCLLGMVEVGLRIPQAAVGDKPAAAAATRRATP